MAGLNTIGVTLKYGAKGSAPATEVKGIMEIPDLGGDVDKIEVTTLASESHEYINGLRNNGDTMTFKCLYVETEFSALNALDDEQSWEIDFSETGANLKATWDGIPSVKLDSVTVGGYLGYSLNIAPTSKITLTVA